MKRRFYSAFFLLLVIATSIALDRWLDTAWFTTALLAAVLFFGLQEFMALLRQGARLAASEPPHPMRERLGRGAAAALCIGVPGAFMLAMRWQTDGLLRVLYLLAVSKMVDNGALFVGSWLGRHKLAPKISPAKTIEGVVGGLLAGVAPAGLLGPVCTSGHWPFFLMFGGVIGVLSILGDLAESVLKRKAGVKDSGAWLPGIGGILDLLDSVLLSAPAAYFLLAR